MARSVSLRRRLLAWLLAATALLWSATALLSYFEAGEELDELMDAHLAQAASLLIAQGGHDLDEIDTEHAPTLHRYARNVAFQFWERGRELRLHSANAPDTPLADRPGFSDSLVDGERWRVFSTWDEERRYLVQVGERSAARRSVTRELLAGLLQPLLFALPLLALGAWFATGRGLRPLTALAEQVRRRRPGDLAPIDVPGTPVEARPLVVALDGLMARVAASLDSERRFTGDAAHELRTPLAAIKAQAQVARGARDAAERERALAGVEAGCERGAHLVEQLLTLSRLDAAAAPAPQRCTLGPLVREVLAESAAQAAGKDMALRFDAQDDPPVDAVPELLRVLLRNLVDNAIRYSPPGTGVSAVQRREGDRLLLEVIDEGPGIPEDEREKALQRFYRVLGSGQPGSGLGLSIAQRIAALHEGTLELAKGPGGRGLNARLRLPLAR